MLVRRVILFDSYSFFPLQGLHYMRFTQLVILIRSPAIHFLIRPCECVSWSSCDIFDFYWYLYKVVCLSCTIFKCFIISCWINMFISPKIHLILSDSIWVHWSSSNLQILRNYINTLFVDWYENWPRYDFVFLLFVIIHIQMIFFIVKLRGWGWGWG